MEKFFSLRGSDSLVPAWPGARPRPYCQTFRVEDKPSGPAAPRHHFVNVPSAAAQGFVETRSAAGDQVNEVVCSSEPCRVFFDLDPSGDALVNLFCSWELYNLDIDASQSKFSSKKRISLPEFVVQLLHDASALSGAHVLPCDPEEIKLFDMCRDIAFAEDGETITGKASFHVVYSHVWATGETLRDYHTKIRDSLRRSAAVLGYPPGLADMIDIKASAGSFNLRAPGSKKIGAPGSGKKIPEGAAFADLLLQPADLIGRVPGEDRVIRFKKAERRANLAAGAPLDIPAGEIGAALAAAGFEGLVFTGEETNGYYRLSREAPGACPICERVHKSDNASLFRVDDDVLVRCFRAGKGRARRLMTIDSDAVKPGTALGAKKKRVSAKERRAIQERELRDRAAAASEFNDLRADIEYDAPRCDPARILEALRTGSVADGSGCGLGKTRAVLEALAVLRRRDGRLAVVTTSYRVALLMQTAGLMEDCVFYRDCKQGKIRLKEGMCLVIQYDSIHRLNTTGVPYLMLVDEPNGVRRQMFGGEGSAAIGAISAYEWLVRGAWRVLLLDADLDRPGIAAYQALRDEPIVFMRNSRPSHLGRSMRVIMPRDFDALVRERFRALAATPPRGGQRGEPRSGIVVVAHCRDEVHGFESLAREFGLRVMAFSGAISDGAKKEMFSSPDECLQDVDVLVYNGVCEAGLSIESPHWKTVLCRLRSDMGDAQAASQMLYRARAATEYVFAPCHRHYKDLDLSADRIYQSLVTSRGIISRDLDEGTRSWFSPGRLDRNSFRARMFIEHRLERNRTRANFAGRMMARFAAVGMDVSIFYDREGWEKELTPRTSLTKSTATHKKEAKTAMAAKIVTKERLEGLKYAKPIDRPQNEDEENTQALQIFKHAYNMTNEQMLDLTPDKFSKYATPKKRQTYRRYRTMLDGRIGDTYLDDWQYGQLNPGLESEKHSLAQRVLALIGIADVRDVVKDPDPGKDPGKNPGKNPGRDVVRDERKNPGKDPGRERWSIKAPDLKAILTSDERRHPMPGKEEKRTTAEEVRAIRERLYKVDNDINPVRSKSGGFPATLAMLNTVTLYVYGMAIKANNPKRPASYEFDFEDWP